MKTFKMFVTTILVLMLGFPAMSANAAGTTVCFNYANYIHAQSSLNRQ